jgi:hypothetical protein
MLPEGVFVDVLGCFRDGALGGCGGRPGAIIAVGGMARHHQRWIDHVIERFSFAGLVAFMTLAACAIWIHFADSSTFKTRKVTRR